MKDDNGYSFFPVSCKVILFDKTLAKVLLIHYSALEQNKFGLAGGHLELGENLLDCAIRETSEELGSELAKHLNLRRGDFMYSRKNDKIVLFYYDIVDESLAKLARFDENTEDDEGIDRAEFVEVEKLRTGEADMPEYDEIVLDLVNKLKEEK